MLEEQHLVIHQELVVERRVVADLSYRQWIRQLGPSPRGMNPHQVLPPLGRSGPDRRPPQPVEPPTAPVARRLWFAAPRLTAASVVVVTAFNWQRIVTDPTFFVFLASFGLAATLTVLIHEGAHYAVGSMLGLDDLVIRVGPFFGYVGPADGETDVLAQLTPGGRIAFACAGPAANLATYFLLDSLLVPSFGDAYPMQWVHGLVRMLMILALLFGLLNLLPISVLDGGRITHAAIAMLQPASRPAALCSFRAFTAAVCAVWLLHAAASGRHWGWVAADIVQICGLGVLGLVVELPRKDDDLADGLAGQTATDTPSWAVPVLVAAFAAGLGVGHMVGLALYAG